MLSRCGWIVGKLPDVGLWVKPLTLMIINLKIADPTDVGVLDGVSGFWKK
jgi:hypothetical protein